METTLLSQDLMYWNT